MADSQIPSVSIDRFIDGMRNVPSVVTVVTMADSSGPWGITIGSFVSLSLEPPLVCFNVQKGVPIHDPIVEADRYIVHVLREEQAELSDLFARSDISMAQKFSSISYDLDGGCPRIENALVRFHCRRHDVLPGGDHSILVGVVHDVQHGDAGRPVVYHRRSYHGIGEHIADRQQE